MPTAHAQSRRIAYFLIRMSLVILLLGSCSRAQWMEERDREMRRREREWERKTSHEGGCLYPPSDPPGCFIQ
jgi:hypothetical protein